MRLARGMDIIVQFQIILPKTELFFLKIKLKKHYQKSIQLTKKRILISSKCDTRIKFREKSDLRK